MILNFLPISVSNIYVTSVGSSRLSVSDLQDSALFYFVSSWLSYPKEHHNNNFRFCNTQMQQAGAYHNPRPKKNCKAESDPNKSDGNNEKAGKSGPGKLHRCEKLPFDEDRPHCVHCSWIACTLFCVNLFIGP